MSITCEDQEAFTEGGCYILARALHRATGWPMYAFWGYYWPEGDYQDHVFVRTPSGTYLDIEGEHTANEMWRRWDAINNLAVDIREVGEKKSYAWRLPTWAGFLYTPQWCTARAIKLVPEVLSMVAAEDAR